ncbi:hypothetical protein B0H13DRAFT_2025883 [Mycena leptocephala]|nr:hypothetical protein B0H13DRAFT_2025883 [Mycena leptocephala]
MSSLLERIEEISSLITRQKNVLRDLEKSRSHLRRQLNSTLDPIARLPLELSSDIFQRCLPMSSYPDPHYAPMLFLNVCHSWTEIALSTPSLWAAIDIECPREKGDDFSTLLELCVCTIIDKVAGRVENLELYVHSDGLQRMKAPLPALKTLTIAPSLIEFTLDQLHFLVQDVPYISTHSTLMHLSLGDENSDVEGSGDVLRYLTLPSLNRLWIFDFSIREHDFFDFLTRSSPPLLTLSIRIPFGGWTAGHVDTLSRLLPGLTHIEIHFAPSTEIDVDSFPIVEALALSGCRTIFPKLSTLIIHGWTPSQSRYQKLVTTLSSRSLCLRTCRLVVYKSTCHNRSQTHFKPNLQIIATLQSLVEAGVNIHIGRGGRNWI